ncbi:hypothetical protein Hanom_Chr07g00666341 [Helianthus anomalus]
MIVLNCIKRLQCNLIRHLILSQSLLTRQLRSWTETALSFNAESFCARARPCAARPLGSLPCAHAPRHHARCVLLAQVHARCATTPCAVRPLSSSPCAVRHDIVRPLGSSPCAVRHVTCEPIRARHTVASYWLTLVRRARHKHHARSRASRVLARA